MRISPIDASLYAKQPNHLSKVTPQFVKEPAFKGAGGAFGTIAGAALGVGLTLLTGGAAAWAVPVLSGLGGIGGEIAHGDESSSSNYPSGYDDISGFDFIG